MDLRKLVTPEIVHGSGARHLAGTYVRNIGATRVLVVSDPGVVAAGWTAEVVRSLEREGLVTHLFTGVTPNPRTTEVALGAELSLEHEGSTSASAIAASRDRPPGDGADRSLSKNYFGALQKHVADLARFRELLDVAADANRRRRGLGVPGRRREPSRPRAARSER